MNSLSTLAAIATARQEIKKSRFLAVAGPVADEAAAKAFIAANSDQTANHNCWAWRVGQAYRFSDDGEPGGTAGKPILQAIEGQSLDSVAVVVTRWFGGVLLGSGGLIRAYGGTAAMCLREAEKVPLVDMVAATFTCTFGDLALLQARLEAIPGAKVSVRSFTDTGAELDVSVLKDDADGTAGMVADLTSGRAVVKFGE
ncbi:MAG: YigZ family protein [Mesorhizobium sp.]|mgnify:CR=1 FL=1|nr:YigZ family protein [Mesorhizobium sp.]MBN9242129.1 YigZ family protein [Mesorhizobium sp.]